MAHRHFCASTWGLFGQYTHAEVFKITWSQLTMNHCESFQMTHWNIHLLMWAGNKTPYKSVCVTTENTISMLAASCQKLLPKLQVHYQHLFYLFLVALFISAGSAGAAFAATALQWSWSTTTTTTTSASSSTNSSSSSGTSSETPQQRHQALEQHKHHQHRQHKHRHNWPPAQASASSDSKSEVMEVLRGGCLAERKWGMVWQACVEGIVWCIVWVSFGVSFERPMKIQNPGCIYIKYIYILYIKSVGYRLSIVWCIVFHIFYHKVDWSSIFLNIVFSCWPLQKIKRS